MENNRRYADVILQELTAETKLAMDRRSLAKRAVNEGTPLSGIELRDSDTEELRNKLLNGARQELARIANFTIVEKPELEVDAGSPQEVTVEGVAKNERVLTPEQAGRVLRALQSSFNANKNLHKGINWKDVEASLKASPEALWSLAQMESAGHAPDVYHDDESGYYFGTCSAETPESARNCVYDKEAADWLRTNHPDAQFNGSAVEMADAMGITLMSPEHYRDILQKKGKFDRNTWGWLLTQSDIRSSGGALLGYRYGGGVYIDQDDARDHNDDGAWRGSLRVKKVKA